MFKPCPLPRPVTAASPLPVQVGDEQLLSPHPGGQSIFVNLQYLMLKGDGQNEILDCFVFYSYSLPTSYSNKLCACVLSCFSHVQLCATFGLQPPRLLCPWRLSRQEYWSGLPSPPPGNLPDPGIAPVSLISPALASPPYKSRMRIWSESQKGI